MKRTILWTIALSLALTTGAMAGHGNGKGNGNGHGNGNSQGKSENKGNSHKASSRDHDSVRWESRDGWEYHNFEGDHRPPGWSQGRKVGWKECGLPPGQAKKYGCYRYRYQNRDYYWYRNDIGHIVVRRPIISAHAGVDIF